MSTELPLTATTLANRLRSLDDEAFAKFVADLWERTGWDVTVEHATLRAHRAGTRPETRRIRVLTDDRSRLDRFLGRAGDLPGISDVDVLVVGHRDGDAVRDAVEGTETSVIDAEDLYHRLLYGVERPTCRSLCRRHLGRAVDPIPPSRREGGRFRVRLGQLLDRARENRRQVAGAAVAVAVVVAFATIGAIGANDRPLIAPGGGASMEDSGEPVTPVGGAGTATLARTPTTAATPTRDGTPTGVDPILTTPGGPDPVSTVDPFDADRFPAEDDRGLPDAIEFNTSESAILTFLQLLDESGGNRSLELELAWRTMTPRTRPSYDVFVNEVGKGVLRPLWSFDRLAFEDAGAFKSMTNDTGDRVRVTAITDSGRWSYVIEATCGGNVTGRCWQVSAVVLLHSSGPPTIDGGDVGTGAENATATSTPTIAPKNGTRTLPYGRSEPETETSVG